MKRNKTLSVLKYIFLAVLSAVSIFPFFWMIISATNTAAEVNAGKLTFGAHLAENLSSLFHSDLHFGASVGNSMIIALITTVLALLISSVAGYGFEIFRSKARDRVFNILLLSMMIPFCALMIPLYRMFGAAGKAGLTGIGLNTLFSVIMPSICTAFLIFFFRQNAKSFPKDILEAARIDGLNEPRIFIHMYVPVMKSSYAAAAIVTFMSSWNNYLWPLVALQDPQKRTVPLILSAMGSSYTPDYGMIMAGIVIATLPTGILFFMMQKQFVAGMIGSVK
ncbi:carbohydrate ABC transporter permease [Caproiciproducens galactitolivorans]|uniref:Carbohydrate ABC transporter permease n=1 Tax=Caproiciproducens galactitolivorans TaxID=642589 RepID=A0ABT4BTQ9_9FIRM|nr:carbohydrate ABC transporter permease [Caproiciproducens galactitolivorans]MCY1713293.1 carbohydrate ABC transporter permease [Caproiciproducens galactitolivorans]